MNYPEVRHALDTGERVRRDGMPCTITGVAIRRKPKRDLITGEWGCVGDWYYGADVIDSTGHSSQVRIEDLRTEEEYQKSKEEHHEQTQSTV